MILPHMKKLPAPQFVVRRSITLPLDLDQFASGKANQDHCGNVSAFLRVLLHAARHQNQIPARKTPRNGRP